MLSYCMLLLGHQQLCESITRALPSGPTFTDHENLSFHAFMQSAGINVKLQMTPDGFTVIGDEHHLFNSTARPTDTPAVLPF